MVAFGDAELIVTVTNPGYLPPGGEISGAAAFNV